MPERIPRITGLSDAEWEEIEATIFEFFTTDEQGRWVHHRIEEDLQRVHAKSEKSRRAGLKSAKKRRLQAIENKRKLNERSTDVIETLQRNGNHTDTYTDTDTDKDQKDCAKSSRFDAGEISKKSVKVPYQKIVDLYHEILPNHPRVATLSPTRKSHLRQRWINDIKSLESWEKYFRHVSKSKFLTGQVQPRPGKKVFIAGIDFLINQNNVLKIIEGNYHD